MKSEFRMKQQTWIKEPWNYKMNQSTNGNEQEQ